MTDSLYSIDHDLRITFKCNLGPTSKCVARRIASKITMASPFRN
ncbi:hypothetical protein L195_g063374, partial [Trifolium pratense]